MKKKTQGKYQGKRRKNPYNENKDNKRLYKQLKVKNNQHVHDQKDQQEAIDDYDIVNVRDAEAMRKIRNIEGFKGDKSIVGFVEYEMNRVKVDGEHEDGKLREEDGVTIEPLNMNEERDEGSFDTEGFYKTTARTEKGEMRDDWLRSTVDSQQAGRKKNKFASSMNRNYDQSSIKKSCPILADTSKSSVEIEREHLNTVLKGFQWYQNHIDDEKYKKISIHDLMADLYGQKDKEDALEKLVDKIGQSVAVLSGLYSVQVQKLHDKTYKYFEDRMKKVRIGPLQWEYQIRSSDNPNQIHGSFPTSDIVGWLPYFENATVYIRVSKEKDDDEDVDMFSDDEEDEHSTKPSELVPYPTTFVDIQTINFDYYC